MKEIGFIITLLILAAGFIPYFGILEICKEYEIASTFINISIIVMNCIYIIVSDIICVVMFNKWYSNKIK